MVISSANIDNSGDVLSVYRSAFPEDEYSDLPQLAVEVLSENTMPSILSLVATEGSKLVGHVVFSPFYEEGSHQVLGYILAPLAVGAEQQGHGIGSQLVEHGIRQLSDQGVSVFLVYGDPKHYGRFGFRQEGTKNFIPPYELEHPFGWQVLNRRKTDTAPTKIRCVQALSKPELW